MTGQPLQRDPTLSARSRGQRLGQSLLSTGHTLAGKQRVIAGRRSDPAAITLLAAEARQLLGGIDLWFDREGAGGLGPHLKKPSSQSRRFISLVRWSPTTLRGCHD